MKIKGSSDYTVIEMGSNDMYRLHIKDLDAGTVRIPDNFECVDVENSKIERLVLGVFERRGVKAGPQATAQAARSGLYAS